jgi:hypothetical protein
MPILAQDTGFNMAAVLPSPVIRYETPHAGGAGLWSSRSPCGKGWAGAPMRMRLMYGQLALGVAMLRGGTPTRWGVVGGDSVTEGAALRRNRCHFHGTLRWNQFLGEGSHERVRLTLPCALASCLTV